MRRKLMWISAVAATVGALAPMQASAAPADTFGCRASGLRVNSPIINSEPIVSNKPGSPCVDDSDVLATVGVPPLVSTGVVVTNTDLSPGGAQGAKSTASVDNLMVNAAAVVIKAKVVTSTATVSCGAAGPVLAGSSQVAGLTINGVPINVINQPLTIPAGPLLVVAINEKTLQPGKITQRALHVRSALLGIDIAVAESIADIEGSPCTQPPPKQCADGADNDGDGKVDAADPGCHTDGNPNNPGSYDPSDDDESNPPPAQCSDSADNDGDGKVDAADPGCHTDGNPNNPGSYDPNDNDESNVPPKQCSDAADNDGDGKVDAADPGCHTDGNPNNPGSYNPNDDDETNVPPKQCSDAADNDGDGKVDAADPGCHTDGNPNNPGSYNPNDDDESNPPTQCSDGADNDDDKLTDAGDPGCHTDGNPNNPGSYNPGDDDESDK